MKKRILITISLFFLSIGAVSCKSLENKKDDIIILFTNDIHCEIKDGIVSFAALKQYKDELKKQYQYVTLVDSGDAIEGSVYGTMSKGDLVVDSMNLVGFDYSAIGNHEFNYGADRLHELIKRSNSTYINSNITYDGINENWIETLPKYKIVDYGGTKVAYLGITTPLTPVTAAPTLFMENEKIVYHFDNGGQENFYNTIQDNINCAKNEGADYVIALAHLGDGEFEDNIGPYSSTDLAQQTTGLDVILDGHTHTQRVSSYVKNKDSSREVLISQSGTLMESFGQLIISSEGKISVSLVAGKLKEDKSVVDEIDNLSSKYEQKLDELVATTNQDLNLFFSDLSTRIPRFQECGLGDYCADSMMHVVSKSTNLDIAFLNGGGIRAPLKKGNVTFRDIISVNPFNNDIVVSELTGQQIMDMWEYFTKDVGERENASLMSANGLKFDVYKNRTFDAEIDKDKNLIKVNSPLKDRRVQNMQVYNKTLEKYEDIVLTKIYRVASYDYILANGGEGMLYFLANNKPIIREISRDYQTLINYMQYLNGDLTNYTDEYISANPRMRIRNIQE